VFHFSKAMRTKAHATSVVKLSPLKVLFNPCVITGRWENQEAHDLMMPLAVRWGTTRTVSLLLMQ
jgi:hypothetical protein